MVITRNWDVAINKPSDISKSSGTEEKSVVTEQSAVYYLPYQASLKDKIYAQHGDSKYRLLRKALSFFELVFQNYFLRVVPFSNFYDKAVELIEQNPGLDKLVITANPFVSFFIGYRLKQKFPKLKWVADYRDDWSTSDIAIRANALANFIFGIESKSEKKWVGTASVTTTISPYYAQKISGFTGIPGKTLLNGCTLYPTQPIELFLNGFKQVVDKYGSKLTFRLNFPGLAYDAVQAERVRSNMKGYEHTLHITERIPRAQVFDIQNQSHAFLMVAHQGIKGIPSSKLYEYLCFKKPVLLCPNDNDIIEETVNDTGTGVVCNTESEVYNSLSRMAEDLIGKGKVQCPVKEERVMSYSRNNQAKVLAEILNGL
jgi:hypothetical protein